MALRLNRGIEVSRDHGLLIRLLEVADLTHQPLGAHKKSDSFLLSDDNFLGRTMGVEPTASGATIRYSEAIAVIYSIA
jgi:hypothetical protein